MKRNELYEGIGFPKEAERMVEQLLANVDLYKMLHEDWKKDRSGFYEELEKKGDYALVFFIQKALDVYEEYMRQRIGKQIFFDTFRDITLWSNVYYQKHGTYGVGEIKWLALSIEQKLYRIGRLQFEPKEMKEELQIGASILPIGANVLQVHIPEGEPLTASRCREAFREASRFFGEQYEYAICCSWLLSPAILEHVSADSNIAKFQKLFTVYETVYSFRQAEERVFGYISDKKEKYPEKTRLQKSLKQAVIQGKDIGMGCGMRRLLES